MKKSGSYQDHLIEDLKDPKEAAAYLNAAIEDGDREAFVMALRNVVEAQTSMASISKQSHIHRVSLHKMLSRKGNPTAENLMSIFKIVGIRLVIGPTRNRRKTFDKAA